MKTRPLVALLALALALPFAAFAEDVLTKTDGAKLRGKVLSDTPEEVKIKTSGGVITVPRGEVMSVDRAKDLAQELAARTADLAKHPSPAGWLKLAHWCEDHSLWVPSLDAYKMVVKLDADNEEAWTVLGYRRLHGKWVTESQFKIDQGYVLHEGQWVTKADEEKYEQGLVKWGDDEWITREEADRREKQGAADAEHDRQGIPTHPGETPAPASPASPGASGASDGHVVAPVSRAGKDTKPRYFEGKLLYTKSRDQILKMLDQIANEVIPPLGKPANTDFAPLDDKGQAAGLRRLKQYRYLCDVPTDTELNPDYAVQCAAAVRLLDIIGHLDHTPQQPVGCPDNLYKVGYQGTSHSNLHQASFGPTPAESVDSFMFDSDQSDIDRVGHRRWCLNSAQKATAFGVWKQFAAMYSADSGRQPVPYDAVLYPSRGYFPSNFIRHDAAWSAHLSSEFGRPEPSAVKVALTPVDVNLRKGPPLELEYLHVDEGGFGHGVACVIFRAKAISMAPGDRYWVAISGLKDPSGNDTTLEYLVEFF